MHAGHGAAAATGPLLSMSWAYYDCLTDLGCCDDGGSWG